MPGTFTTPAWGELRSVIVDALAYHPNARAAVFMAVAALGESDTARGGDL